MMQLKQIGEYIVNPLNIAYIEDWVVGGRSKGSRIIFNAYAAAANCQDWRYEPLAIEIFGVDSIKIMDFINTEQQWNTVQNATVK